MSDLARLRGGGRERIGVKAGGTDVVEAGEDGKSGMRVAHWTSAPTCASGVLTTCLTTLSNRPTVRNAPSICTRGLYLRAPHTLPVWRYCEDSRARGARSDARKRAEQKTVGDGGARPPGDL